MALDLNKRFFSRLLAMARFHCGLISVKQMTDYNLTYCENKYQVTDDDMWSLSGEYSGQGIVSCTLEIWTPRTTRASPRTIEESPLPYRTILCQIRCMLLFLILSQTVLWSPNWLSVRGPRVMSSDMHSRSLPCQQDLTNWCLLMLR